MRSIETPQKNNRQSGGCRYEDMLCIEGVILLRHVLLLVRAHQWMSGCNPPHISCCQVEWENGICAIWKTPVEVRRNRVGAFLVQLFWHKKSLQGWKSTPCRLFRAEREGLATTLLMVAPFNAFPFCSPQGPLQKRDSNGAAEAGIHLKINIYLFPQPPRIKWVMPSVGDF